jgi:hypothetical protein
MLPGFRFLFAAIMLSMSLLVFGLGAAALLRAAHESFASNSSWRAAPEAAFAQPPETTLPMLATLSVEPATEKPADPATITAAPAEPATPAITVAQPAPVPAIPEPAKNDQVAAAKPTEAPAQVTKPDNAPAEMPAAQNAPEAAPAPPITAEPAAPANGTKTAAGGASDASSASEPAAVPPEPAPPPANPPTVTPAVSATPTASAVPAPAAEPVTSAASAAPATSPETSEVEAKIATLGGPPVDVTDSESAVEPLAVKLPRARPDENIIKKRQQARRALRRRRLAARARLLAQQQLQANPFAQQPFAQPQQTYALQQQQTYPQPTAPRQRQ